MNPDIEIVLGFAIVLIVLFDVFSTVLVPRASTGGVRFGVMLAHLLAPVWRRIAGALPSARLRQGFRGALGPFILVLSLGGWIASLAVGFALLLHAQPHNVSLDSFAFGEALFQSALALSTMGLIHADINGWARAVVAIAGLTGFSIVSLVVAFLLSIQAALNRREALVLTLPARAGRPPSALKLLEVMADADDAALATMFGAWERWTADVVHSHLSFPILCRFRSLDEDVEWLACLGVVLDAAALIVAGGSTRHPMARHAGQMLLGTAVSATYEFGRLLRVDAAQEPFDRTDFDTVHARLAALGYASAPELEQNRARFDLLRGGYAFRLAAFADQLDIAWCSTVLGRDAAA